MNLCQGALPSAGRTVNAQEGCPLFLQAESWALSSSSPSPSSSPQEGYTFLTISSCTLESLRKLLKNPWAGPHPGISGVGPRHWYF